MEGEDEIEIGQVDCGTDKPVCSKVDIHSYPTFKLFYNGEEVAKYQGKIHVSYVCKCKMVYWYVCVYIYLLSVVMTNVVYKALYLNMEMCIFPLKFMLLER